jgi:hypothetical protein
MTRRASWVAVCMAVCAVGWGASRASAAPELTTIYLQNGGKLRGEIVIDMPGAPLTVMVAGQAIQIPRESIARIDAGAQAPVPAPYAAQPAPVAQPAPAPVGVAMVAAPAPMYGAPPGQPAQPAPMLAPAPMAAPTGPLVLQIDRRGRAAIDANWTPELQQLVARRNDLSYSLKRKGLGAPIGMLSIGIIGIITTAAATTVAANNCVYDYDYDDYYYDDGCSDSIAVGMGIGYGISTALLAGGATFLMVRLLKKKSLKRQLALIDQDLQRFNVRAMAKVNGFGGKNGSVAGLVLRASF